MRIIIHEDAGELGRAAAAEGAAAITDAIAARGEAVIVVATGASQFATLSHLVGTDVDFSRVTAFHLDEYIGIPATHPASFRRYLRERFVDRLPRLREFVFVDGDAPDIGAELDRLAGRIGSLAIDLCLAGIGENGHLAFNDPPADFDTVAPYLEVELDAACRAQQMGEGWFATLDEVPRRAISMSIRQMLKAGRIVLSVPDARKAAAVQRAVGGPVDRRVPASILQTHPSVSLHLDRASAALLPD